MKSNVNTTQLEVAEAGPAEHRRDPGVGSDWRGWGGEGIDCSGGVTAVGGACLDVVRVWKGMISEEER